MSLLLGPMCQHIPGHKKLTDDKPCQELMPDKDVYIPLVTGNNTNYEVKVQEGEHVDVGTLLAVPRSGFYVPIYSSVSGTYKGLVKRAHSSLRPQQHMEIEVDHQQTRVESFKPLNWREASVEELREFIKNAGLVGLGGAGFPTYIKYADPKDIQTVIINAVECEPYITADYLQVMTDTNDLIEGALAMKRMSTASKVIIAIKKSHPDMIEKVQQAITGNGAQGVEVQAVPDVYPMGWERVLVREIMHKEYNVLPAEAGCIVNNAGTAIEFAKALREGKALDYKYVTMSGAGLKDPVNVRVPIGMCVHEIIEKIGGFDMDSVFLIAGGPMMGKTMVKDELVIDRAMNAITVLPYEEHEAQVCLRCGSCSDHCPAGLQPVRIAAAVKEGNIEEMEKRGAMSCIECGLCTYVCPSFIQVTENVRKAKRTLQLQKQKQRKK